MSETVPTVAPAEVWTADDSTFAARLALIRQRMGWNAKEAALACGIPQQSWRSWEAGTMPHGSRYWTVCEQIAEATGCDAGWLVDRRPSGGLKVNRRYLRKNLRSYDGGGVTSAPRSPLVQCHNGGLTSN